MKNIHVLKSDKPSRLHLGGSGLVLCDFVFDKSTINGQHIYITDDKEIKPNEWYENNGVIFKADTVFDEGNNPNNSNPRVTGFNKKIILTTDQDLIKDGVQAIDDEFLEWYVKNPSCEVVDVEKQMLCTYCGQQYCNNLRCRGWEDIPYYEIIIPREESKQENCCTPIGQIKRYLNCVGCDRKPKQETLEETAKSKAFEFKFDYKPFETDLDYREYAEHGFEKGFIDGTKHQAERMHSEEDLVQLLNFVSREYNISNGIGWFHTHESNEDVTSKEVLDKWFEQFKKK
jgi:hypothetical protein